MRKMGMGIEPGVRRWQAQFRELARFREVVSGWFSGSADNDISPEVLENYCTQFVFLRKPDE